MNLRTGRHGGEFSLPDQESRLPRRPEPADSRGLAFEIQPSAMVERPGFILRWLGRAFFGAVAFDERHRKTIQDAAARGTLVYVLHVKSLLDLLYFNYAFVTWSLPLVVLALGMNLLFFRPIGEFWRYLTGRLFGRFRRRGPDRELLREALANGQACLLSLKRPHSLIQWGDEDRLSHLRDLIEVQREIGRPVVLVPLLVVWDKKPESYRRSIMDVVFGDPQAPGALRKAVSFFRNFRSARAQVGRPLELGEFLQGNADAPDTEVLAARLKFILSQEFLLESKAIRGPVLKGARRMVDEIMRTPPFLEQIETIANSTGIPVEAAMQRARASLLAMAADFRFNWLESFAFTIGLIFQRLFRGLVVDTSGLDAIRDAARYAPIIMVPAHRSHIDYLLISLIFYTHGLIPPHIAAGDNLSFWPMGPIFRHSGAFFIRRKVKGDPLYQAVLAQYIRKLLKEGYWIEFFIEGTRSRSGKSLSPRTGMLSMIVDAVASGAAPDANLVPTAITYEKVIEERSYHAESAGHEKQRENAAALAKSAKVLKTRYGKVYLQFDRPISLVGYLRSQGVNVPLAPGEQVPADVVRRLGHILVHQINQCFLVTPHHLVAFALLTHPKRGIEYETLLERIGFLLLYMQARGARLSDLLGDPLRDLGLLVPADRTPAAANATPLDAVARRGLVGFRDEDRTNAEAIAMAISGPVNEVLQIFHREKTIAIREFEPPGTPGSDRSREVVVSVAEDRRMVLDYYKNGVIHYFVPDAILALAALHPRQEERPLTIGALRDRVKALSRIFKFEFIYGAHESYEAIFDATLRGFLEDRLLIASEDGRISVAKDSEDILRFFAGIVGPFVEGYRVLGRVVASSAGDESDRELVRSAIRFGRKALTLGDVRYPEAINAILFRNALHYLRSEIEDRRAADLVSAARSLLEHLP